MPQKSFLLKQLFKDMADSSHVLGTSRIVAGLGAQLRLRRQQNQKPLQTKINSVFHAMEHRNCSLDHVSVQMLIALFEENIGLNLKTLIVQPFMEISDPPPPSTPASISAS